MAETKLHALVAEWHATRKTKEELEEALKAVNLRLDAQNKAVVAEMDATDVKKVEFEGIGLVHQRGEFYARVKDEAALISWLDANGGSAMAKRSVHPSTLKAFVRERLEANLPVPDGVDGYSVVKAVLRGGGE